MKISFKNSVNCGRTHSNHPQQSRTVNGFCIFSGILLFALIIVMFATLSKTVSAQTVSDKTVSDKTTDQTQLPGILEQTGQYCEKLKGAVFHFFCREKMTETIEKSVSMHVKPGGLGQFLQGGENQRRIEQWSNRDVLTRKQTAGTFTGKKRTRTNTYVNDYQIIKSKNGIREKRMMVSVDGKKMKEKKRAGSTFLYSFKNAITPIYLFSNENQHKYEYALLGKKRTMGRDAYLIEVGIKGYKPPVQTPKAKKKKKKKSKKGKTDKYANDAGKVALAWIDCRDHTIMKLRVLPGAIEGYSKLLHAKENDMNNITLSDTHEFKYLRQGIRYPTQTEIEFTYTRKPRSIIKSAGEKQGKKMKRGIVVTRIKSSIKYDKYIFFGVAVDEPTFR